MNQHEELIKKFYTCFQKKDFRGMQDCYADNAVFSDPVFINLDAGHLKAMWQMLVTRGRDLDLEFSDIRADEITGSAVWKATYSFSQTGRKVVNPVEAGFIFSGGKIIRHTDSFHFYNWAKQAFGISGLLLGWTAYFKNKIRKTARINLDKFIKRN
jgi:ketosteroid isomerase-like protein